MTEFAQPAAGADAEELTEDEARKLLRISRARLGWLVNDGLLGAGAVRVDENGLLRLSKSAVLAYKSKKKQRQAEALSAMVEASQRLGLYDDEKAGPLRSNSRTLSAVETAKEGETGDVTRDAQQVPKGAIVYEEHSHVVLMRPLPELGLISGDVGVVVHIHNSGEAYVVEFQSLDGHTIGLPTLHEADLRKAPDNAVLHLRERT